MFSFYQQLFELSKRTQTDKIELSKLTSQLLNATETITNLTQQGKVNQIKADHQIQHLISKRLNDNQTISQLTEQLAQANVSIKTYIAQGLESNETIAKLNQQLIDQSSIANLTITTLEQRLDEMTNRTNAKRTKFNQVASDVYFNLTQILSE